MERFDLLNVPLKGANLLEAGAGTGKTYNIEGLFLRLIIEEALPVNSILVVTYTVAATEELRDRIHCRLRRAAQAFARGESDDRLLGELLAKYPQQPERLTIQRHLQGALRDFDEAAIYTIHSFCQRIMQENAFESDALFDTQLITDEGRLREEIVDDFWRTHFYETLPEVAGQALACGFSPSYLLELLGQAIPHHDIRIIPPPAPSNLEAIRGQIGEFNDAFAALQAAWPRVREEIYLLLSGPALHAGTYGSKSAGLCRAMEAGLDSGGPFFPLGEHVAKFTCRHLAAKVKKNHQPPEHEFFRLCQDVQDRAAALEQELEAYLLHLKREFIATARQKLAARKEKDNVVYFDDLLVRLRRALEQRGGEELARLIRTRYRAALIDEFQDTDPVQFAIFGTLFGQGEYPLFLIGDPKQAIYSFRGADIFAYLQAAAVVKGKYTIAENWRSEPGLLRAVNTIFSQRGNPFVHPAIDFTPASAPPERSYEYLTIAGRQEAPCRWWFVRAEKHGTPLKPLAKGKARSIIVRAVAGETARLLKLARRGEVLIGERPLREGDIAVLVRQHREARLMQDAFRRLNIPAVLQKAGSVFLTEEAEEWERVLRALANPADEGLVRAALLTDLLGMGVAEMGRLARNEEDWARWLDKFGFYHQLWQDAGFMSMFEALLSGEEVKTRLLAFPDGERRVTNLLHLAELLLRAIDEGKYGIAGLAKWMAEQRSAERDGSREERQLRLESDAQAVHIVTIHQSKGLEYPVVFCPFTWEGSEVKGEAVAFHGTAGEGEVTLDIGSATMPLSRAQARLEQLAENVRLLYVALTRARHRCYFIWGRFNQAETSAPAYLFHAAELPGGDAASELTALAAGYNKLDDELMLQRLTEIARQADGCISLSEIPEEEEALATRPAEQGGMNFQAFSGKIDRSWRIVSFSSLVADRPPYPESPDYDGQPAAAGAILPDRTEDAPVGGKKSFPAGAEDIFTFPRGAGVGTLLHDILRYLDFQEERADEVRSLVAKKLQLHGFDPRWEGVIVDQLRKLVTLPLRLFVEPAGTAGGTFRLAEVAGACRLNELEFYFPLRRLTGADLQDIFGKAGYDLPFAAPAGRDDRRAPVYPSVAERLRFHPARGFMKGFMDLVFFHEGRFYLVDWKSNFLGAEIADYGAEGLNRAMADSFYILQYHLYTLATHLYLGARLPGYSYERHFGGVYYIFLRGLDPAPAGVGGREYGIFRDRPPADLVAEMEARLIAR